MHQVGLLEDDGSRGAAPGQLYGDREPDPVALADLPGGRAEGRGSAGGRGSSGRRSSSSSSRTCSRGSPRRAAGRVAWSGSAEGGPGGRQRRRAAAAARAPCKGRQRPSAGQREEAQDSEVRGAGRAAALNQRRVREPFNLDPKTLSALTAAAEQG